MLVLTRKIDQGIVISGNIVIRVLGVERDRVKIGISAPLNVTVLRQELLDRDANEKRAEPADGSLTTASKSDEAQGQS
jgi:carbon storage regulator